jgi:hypothetical protein
MLLHGHLEAWYVCWVFKVHIAPRVYNAFQAARHTGKIYTLRCLQRLPPGCFPRGRLSACINRKESECLNSSKP